MPVMVYLITTNKTKSTPDNHVFPPEFLDLIFPQHPPPNGTHSQHPRCCDKPTHTLNKKTRKKHRKRKSEALKNRPQTGQTQQTKPKLTHTPIQRPRWQQKRTHTNTSTTLTAPPLGPSQPPYQHKCDRQKGAVKRGQKKNRPKEKSSKTPKYRSGPYSSQA
jgi:hypothetical protein